MKSRFAVVGAMLLALAGCDDAQRDVTGKAGKLTLARLPRTFLPKKAARGCTTCELPIVVAR